MYDPQYPECDCDRCTWCHDAYEHDWRQWTVPIEQWDCKQCQADFEESIKASMKSGQCEWHNGDNCEVCRELAFKQSLDRMVDNDIEYWKESNNEY